MYTLKLSIQSLQNNNHIIQLYLSKIKNFLKNQDIIIKGNIQQNKKNTIYTVLKSPHVNKKSREQFNFHLYKQTYFILSSNMYLLINFLIIFKKIMPKNMLLKIQIKKN
jgi:small subunit ribosomal protein S10